MGRELKAGRSRERTGACCHRYRAACSSNSSAVRPRCARSSDGNVVCGGEVVATEVLEDDVDVGAQRRQVIGSGTLCPRRQSRAVSGPETAVDSVAERFRLDRDAREQVVQIKSVWLATCESPPSRLFRRSRRRRKQPARDVRSPIENSPCSVRHRMSACAT
jgi:hypothetical protein